MENMLNLRSSIETFSFRCSSLGNIVTKSGKLTEGAKTYIEEVYIGLKWGVYKEAFGKQLEKGKACEQDGFKMLNLLYPGSFVSNESESKQNKYIKGLCDHQTKDGIIVDIKNAYDRFTFGKAHLSHLYEWQIKGYCFLYKKTKGMLFYCLNNMPDYLIADEERKMFYTKRKWTSMEDPDYIEACNELRSSHIYDHIPVEQKFKIWNIEYTKEDEDRIINSVKLAREYMIDIYQEDLNHVEYNLSLLSKSQELTEII